MLLCLDVGNTHIVAGIFDQDKLILHSRYATNQMGTADQFGLFLRNILLINNLDAAKIDAIAVASVVPACNYTIRHATSLYFPQAAYFMLQAGVKTGINIKYKNPNEVGADLIAGAIGAVNALPGTNMIVADLGTATTLAAITAKNDFLGGVIMPGMRVAMESLRSNTAKLMEVDIEIPETYLGQSTRECIQRGLYFSHLGGMKEIIAGYKAELFPDTNVAVIGTGGFSQLFKDTGIFDIILPDLVLQGIRIAYENSVVK